jgi:TonB family protein
MKHRLAFLIAPLIAPLIATTIAIAAEPEDPRVQAFIPILNPAGRVAVVYPELARPRNLVGMVQVLITLDPVGKVIQAEALTGPGELRQAATDALKQWTYRPVIRNGQPVYAMTTAMVDVAPPCPPGAPCAAPRPKTNPVETVAAFERIRALEQQWPRTSAMVQADLEQQSAGDTGVQRFYELRGLAKAAVEAGALDKARAYAAELLQMAPQYPRDWNYGNAVHDGNMVLGQVALREGNAPGARQYLLEAGKTSGSPQLNSFGPNMRLAKELIDANDRDSVLRYFDLCRSFWKMGGKKLDDWTAMVRGGGKPDFGANLAY